MIDKSQQVQLKRLLSEAILLLCRNGLPIDSEFSIEAMIGITLSEDEVFLVSFRETVAPASTENSFEPQPTEPTDKIARHSHSGRYIRKGACGRWAGNVTDIYEPAEQIENVEDSDEEMEKGSCYDSRLRGFGRDIVIKSEVDFSVAECSSDYVVRNTDDHKRDEMCKNGEFEARVKSELDGYDGFGGFARSGRDSESSIPVIDTTSVSSLCRKPMSSTASHWLPLNCKGRRRSQTLQRSMGSRYSSSSDQRQKGHVYQQETAESVTSVEKILNAIYPPTDNQSLRCHVCGAELKCRRTLMEHIRGTHLSIHSYHCPDCGLGFKWRSSLKHHRARNCTLPSAMAAAYNHRPPGSRREPVSWADSH